ncbi:MAG: D-cysteine desulfhydrase family protein [Deltaproteobacteria bacterium]|nr:D-cysteine desulfhydrase family protein [Deltaproteobacteria bacterium]
MSVAAPSAPARLDVACLPTRVRPLHRVSAAWGGAQLWIKHDDETGAPLSGNKIRKLQYAIAQAIDAGADTLITCGGIQSNHCRATAALGARLGLRTHLMLRGEAPSQWTGNLLLDRLLGASIHWMTPLQYQRHDALMAELADTLTKAGRRPFVIAEGCSMAVGSWGYIEAAREIVEAQQAHGVEFDAVVHAVGSGGTSAGLELGRRLHGLSARIIGINVCDDADHFVRHIATLAAETVEAYDLPVHVPAAEIEILDGYVGLGYGRSRPEELAELSTLARTEGVLLDPVYGGKAWYALSQRWKTEPFAGMRNVLFLHTGGIYGLFPHADALVEASA